MKRIAKKSQGFSLMELLIVIVILGILVAIGAGSFASSSRRGRDNRRKSDLHDISTALEAYYSDKGKYPASNSSGEIVGCGAGDLLICSWGGQFTDTNGTIYMALMPQDPSSILKYYYVGATSTYKLYARLENTQDEGSGVKQVGYSGTSCGGSGAGLCTYGISSTNTTP